MDLSQSPSGDETRQPLTTAEKRREYQRRYYQLHKDKAKEYQRQYNLTHKKKAQPGQMADREVIQTSLNAEDIMDSVMGQTEKKLSKILKGDRIFTN